MTTIRVARRRRFVIVDNEAVRDESLSLRARGLLALLLSHDDDYRINADTVARTTKEGRDAVRTAMTELEDAGYLVRRREQGGDGRWRSTLTLYELPVRRYPQVELTDDGFPGVGSPGVGIPGVYRKTKKKDSCSDDSEKASPLLASTSEEREEEFPTSGAAGLDILHRARREESRRAHGET